VQNVWYGVITAPFFSALTNMIPNARINRWRLPTEGLDTPPLDEDIPVLSVETRASDAIIEASPEEARTGVLSARDIILGQAEDAFCQARLKELDTLSPPDPTRSRQEFFFREKNGLLCRPSVYGRETQVVIPEAQKKRLLTHQHQKVLAGNPGTRRMYNALRMYVFWPTMVVDVYKHVEQCPACAKNRLSEKTHTTVMKLFTADEHFSGLAMDLLGPLPTSKGGNKHVLVICDRFNKVTRSIPLRKATALTVASACTDTWVAAYGIPDTVVTDNGPQFALVLYQGILGLLGIASNYISLNHPLTNGQVERYIRTLVRQLRCYVVEHQDEWDSHLSLLATAYNTQIHSSFGEIPFASVSPRRHQPIGIERMPRQRQAEERPVDASSAAEQYVGT